MINENIDIFNNYERNQFIAYVGRASSDIRLLAEYENAINLIIKGVKSTKTLVDVAAHPILYLMRHSLEIGYKSNFKYLSPYSKRQTSKNLLHCHDLIRLNIEFKVHFDLINKELYFDNELVVEFENYYSQTTTLINQLGSTEASSFRYTKNTNEQRIFKSTETRDIGIIKGDYDKAVTMLMYTSDLISQYTDYKDLIDKVPDFKWGMGKVKMTFPASQLNSFATLLDDKYEKIKLLKWKDKIKGQTYIIVTVDNKCYLTPLKNERKR